MYIKKQNFNELIARWMKSDPDLWSTLTKVEIKIIHQRITKEYSFEQIAQEVNSTTELVESLFPIIIGKIAEHINHEIAVELYLVHKQLENRHVEIGFGHTYIHNIYLN
ncbi:MAG: hypothetical protein N4A35_17075 [Flavobacteriales bacterium]|jgi:hypothetical protein|nr:hypothetical protein [Flavobacteriales bacterium]